MKTGHLYHKDSFGQLASAIQGGSQWTIRLLRGTKVAVPHIAKLDVFTYRCQFNHEKTLLENVDDFHIHMIPIAAIGINPVDITFDYGWAWLTNGDTYPNTFTHTGIATIQLLPDDQFKYLIKTLILDIPHPTAEQYSSELFVEFTRKNDASDTYGGEFALIDGDSHYPNNRLGSYNRFTDNAE